MKAEARPAVRTRSWRVLAGASAVVAATLPLALLAAAAEPVLDPLWMPIAAGMALLALASLLRPIEPAPGEKFTLAGAVTFFAALTLPAPYAVVAMSTAALTAKAMQRASVVSTTVNVAKVAGAVGAASLVAGIAHETSLVAVVACGTAYVGVTLFSVGTMVAASQGTRAVRPFLAREWLPTVALAGLGGVGAILWSRDPLALVLLLPPLAMIALAARAASRERRTKAELQRAHDAQRAFASDAAHELRTPLATLAGELAYIAPSHLPLDESAALENARGSVERLRSLVERLLVLARMETVEQPTSSSVLAQAIARVVGHVAPRRGVAFDISVPEDLRVALPADLTDVLIRDVVANAAAYTEQGSIRIRARRSAATRIELVVSDTGIGMTTSELQHGFDRFFRGSRARALASGSGLGLAIVRRILESHGGSIAIESAIDRGTTVTLRLPTT